MTNTKVKDARSKQQTAPRFTLSNLPGLPTETFQEFLTEINQSPHLKKKWDQLPESNKEEIRLYYSKEKLPRLTSDLLFKFLFNPETHPERLSELLSLLLGIPVTVVGTLPVDNIPISVYSKQVILDILVRTENGSMINVEIQRIALDFSPKRAAVLSSNLIMRQYSVMSGQAKSDVDYDIIEKVYTVVLFENDYPEFKDHPDAYLHKAHQTFDTGVSVDLMQEYIFVELN